MNDDFLPIYEAVTRLKLPRNVAAAFVASHRDLVSYHRPATAKGGGRPRAMIARADAPALQKFLSSFLPQPRRDEALSL